MTLDAILRELATLRDRAAEMGLAGPRILFELTIADLRAGLGVKPGTLRLLRRAAHPEVAEMLEGHLVDAMGGRAG